MFLVIVDLQRGFLASAAPEGLEGRLARLLRQKVFQRVLATRFCDSEDSPFRRFMGWGGLHGAEADICAAVLPLVDAVIPKAGFTAATESVLQTLQQWRGGSLPERVFLAGTDTEACVLATAMGFFVLGVRPVVLADYCASSGGLAAHEAGLLCMERAIGAENILRGEPPCFPQLP